MSALADIDAIIARAMGAWRPPPRLSLSMWADRYFVLSSESAAEPGRWHTLPYQRQILDAITDPSVTQVSVMKSARVGYSLCMSAAIGYFMHQDPSSILVVQPTVDDAKNFSKETIAPMLRDVPVLSQLLFKDIEEKGKGPKDSSATLQHKALDISTLVPTPDGWTTIADARVGDVVFDERGQRTRISHVTPVFEGRPCYRVRFSDGAEIVCDSEHAWVVERWVSKRVRYEILTTQEIAARGARMGNRYRFAVSNAGPLDLPPIDLPIDPYVLGVWLGDGARHRANIHSGHHDATEMQALLESCGCRVSPRNTGGTMLLQLDSEPAQRDPKTGRMRQRTTGVMGELRELGVLGKVGDSRKGIPTIYLRASRNQREALLQGLMDTDGSIRARDGVCVFTTVIQDIALGFGELLSGLGVKWTRHYRYPHGGRPAVAFIFNPPPSLRVFRLRRKAARQLTRDSLKSGRRRIVAVDPVASVPVKCVTVEAQSHLFLVGARMVPTHNSFPGGILSLIGANSGAGFRRVSRRIIMFDEVDAYPPSAGSEGDQINLGMKRSEAFHNRKIIAGSTPLMSGASRIEELFLAGDQRRYYVPCPKCEHMDFLVFDRKVDRGHVMRWPPDEPEKAYFECSASGCRIDHKDKRWMVERGEWRADNPGATNRSYHLWSALSYSPNASWGQIATEFLEAKRGGPEKLKTFVNTTLGETWKERGDAPDWERLYQRREKYAIGSVPDGPIVLTAGVDVQKDRLMYEVVGWATNKESWSIEAGALWGDTSLESTWLQLDALLNRAFVGHDDAAHTISMLAVDSGYNTQVVYSWARQYPMSRVIATKGISGSRMLVGSPSPVEITVRGKKLSRGYKVWPIGVDIGKSELYGWLRLKIDEVGVVPPGFCHFPEHGEDYFQQLTAEHLVTSINKKTRRTRMEWQVLPNRENHYLDARVMARVAAAVLGIDRIASGARARSAVKPAAKIQPSTPPELASSPTSAEPAAPRSEYWGGAPRGPRASRGGSWFGRRR